jgi:hypothetical protein
MVLLGNTALFVSAVKPNFQLIMYFLPTKYFIYLQLVLSCLVHLQNGLGHVVAAGNIVESENPWQPPGVFKRNTHGYIADDVGNLMMSYLDQLE